MSEENKMINEAKIHIKVAVQLLQNASQTIKPFRRSKFLNILQKELTQQAVELNIFLGVTDSSTEFEWIVEKMPSLLILKAMIRDKELSKVE